MGLDLIHPWPRHVDGRRPHHKSGAIIDVGEGDRGKSGFISMDVLLSQPEVFFEHSDMVDERNG